MFENILNLYISIGRAGRTRPGVCYRLYNEHYYEKMPHDKKPEIHNVNLDYAILKLIDLG